MYIPILLSKKGIGKSVPKHWTFIIYFGLYCSSHSVINLDNRTLDTDIHCRGFNSRGPRQCYHRKWRRRSCTKFAKPANRTLTSTTLTTKLRLPLIQAKLIQLQTNATCATTHTFTTKHTHTHALLDMKLVDDATKMTVRLQRILLPKILTLYSLH